MRGRVSLLFFVPGLIWGSEWVLTRGLGAPVLGGLALRYGIAALILCAIAIARGIRLPTWRLALSSAGAGIGFLVLPAFLTNWASERLSPGLLVVALAMAPLLAALMEGRASGGLLPPLVGGVGGTAVLASQGLSFSATQWAGGLAAFAAAILIAGSVVYTKRELSGVPVIALAAIQLAAGAVCAAGLSLFMEGRSGFDWEWRSAAVEETLAIAGSVLALPLYYRLLRQMESFQVTASQWVTTVVFAVESALLLRLVPEWKMLAGASILIASLGVLMKNGAGDDGPVTLRSTLPPS